MNAQEHDLVNRLFLAAVDLSPSDQRALLESACEDQPDLRSTIERLIIQDGEDSALDVPPDVTFAEQLFSAVTPGASAIGGYSILGVLGRGGMATVYRATQECPQREVALKILDLDGASATLLHRFELEAKVLARVSHPGIASIFEAGLDRVGVHPRAFIAMELVSGLSLSDWRREHAPSPRHAAALLALVCDAVHHAHQRGVIHRDLKPSNIVVSPDGQPKVLDFGVARLTCGVESTSTLPGMLVGTLAYMSPEQLAGNSDLIDTRTDIYALGILLLELLAGQPATSTSGLSTRETVAALRARTLRCSSIAAPGIPHELALIVNKATSPEPSQRYDSAAALAEDLRRWLRHEPISARGPSVGYVFRKWARRNPGVLAATVAAGLATMIGLTAFAWQARVAERASAVAVREARTVEAVVSFIESTFGSVEGRESGPQAKIADILDVAAANNAQQNADDPEVMARLAGLFGRSYLSLGLREDAEKQLRLAVAASSNPRAQHALVARQFLANVLRRNQNPTESLELALAVYRDQLDLRGPHHPDTLFAARCYGLACAASGDAPAAREFLLLAAEGYSRVLGPSDPATLHARGDVARLHVQSGDHALALEILEPDYATAVSTLKCNHPVILNLAAKLANARRRAGDAAGAEDVCLRHHESVSTAMGPTHPHTLSLATELARARFALGRSVDDASALERKEQAFSQQP